MWLTAFLKPDFMTISTFRSEKLKDPTEEIFISTVKLLNRKNIVGTLKYTNYEKEIKRILKKNSFSFENWMYDAEQKKYTCPCGNPVPYKKTVTKKNGPGYPQAYEGYQCDK